MDDIFLSTPSARRATSRGERYGCGRGISIHALREEGDQSCTLNLPCYERFLSTPSARRATHSAAVNSSTTDISIHALREEGDRASDAERMENADFYPRPPRGGRPGTPKRTARLKIHFYPRPPRGGRQDITNQVSTAQEFLSTPSARRATCAVDAGHRIVVRFLSTPSARRATVIAFSYAILQEFLSTPSARRATCHRPHCKRPCMPFLSTPSARRATSPHFFVLVARRVFLSTPSARRATKSSSIKSTTAAYFYPRPPRGGRQDITNQVSTAQEFLSTPSARMAT